MRAEEKYISVAHIGILPRPQYFYAMIYGSMANLPDFSLRNFSIAFGARIKIPTVCKKDTKRKLFFSRVAAFSRATERINVPVGGTE